MKQVINKHLLLLNVIAEHHAKYSMQNIKNVNYDLTIEALENSFKALEYIEKTTKLNKMIPCNSKDLDGELLNI